MKTNQTYKQTNKLKYNLTSLIYNSVEISKSHKRVFKKSHIAISLWNSDNRKEEDFY